MPNAEHRTPNTERTVALLCLDALALRRCDRIAVLRELVLHRLQLVAQLGLLQPAPLVAIRHRTLLALELRARRAARLVRLARVYLELDNPRFERVHLILRLQLGL